MKTAGLTSRLFLLLNVSTVVYLVLCQLYLCLLFHLLVLVSKGEGKKKENKIGNPLIPIFYMVQSNFYFLVSFTTSKDIQRTHYNISPSKLRLAEEEKYATLSLKLYLLNLTLESYLSVICFQDILTKV